MFVFLVTTEARDNRARELTRFCNAAILKFGKPCVLSYAPEPVVPGRGHNLDALCIRHDPRSLLETSSEDEPQHLLTFFPSGMSRYESEFSGLEPPTTTGFDSGDHSSKLC